MGHTCVSVALGKKWWDAVADLGYFPLKPNFLSGPGPLGDKWFGGTAPKLFQNYGLNGEMFLALTFGTF